MNNKRLLRVFATLHWLGLAMLLCGVYSLWTTESPSTGSMTLFSSLIGLGLLMIAPYPVVLLIRWSQNNP